MKKVFALILAFAMLLCAMAFAEEVEPQVTTLDPAVEMYVQAIRGLRLRSEMDLTNDENIIRVLALNEVVLVDSIIDDEWAHVTYELPEEEQTEEETTIEGYMWYEYLDEEPFVFTSTAKTDTRTIIVYGAYVLDKNGDIMCEEDGTPITADTEMTKEEYVEYRVLTDPRMEDAQNAAEQLIKDIVDEAEATFDEIFREQYKERTGEDYEEPTVSYMETIEIEVPMLDENGDPVIELDEDGNPVIDEETGLPKPVYETTTVTKKEYIELFYEIACEEAAETIVIPTYEEIVAEAEAEFEAIYEAQQKGVESSTVVWQPKTDKDGNVVTDEDGNVIEEPVVIVPEETEEPEVPEETEEPDVTAEPSMAPETTAPPETTVPTETVPTETVTTTPPETETPVSTALAE